MKRCYKCGEFKPATEFNADRSRKDGLANRCRTCHNAYDAQRSATREAKSMRSTRTRRYRNELRELLDQARVDGCQICGETDTACLDFHHLDPSKKHELPKGISQRTWAPNPATRERIKADLAGCAVLCKNCHAKVHAGRYPGKELKPITIK